MSAAANKRRIGTREWRVMASLTIMVALFFALWDAFFIPLGQPTSVQPLSALSYTPHHRIEAIVRCLMLLVALVTVWLGHGKSARLLTWALIGSSLDIYWQWHGRSGAGLLAIMILKYAGTSLGLMQFLRFAAHFGHGDFHGVRHFLYRAAPLALLLAVCGFSAQFLKLPAGAYAAEQLRFDLLVKPLFYTYLIGDAVVKLAMVVAAAAGLATATEKERQRLLLASAAFCVYALGTALHFLLRAYVGHDTDALNYIDAIASTALPIGAAVSLLKAQFFDVEYYLDRALAGSIVGAGVLFIYYLADHRYGHAAADFIAGWLSAPVVRFIGAGTVKSGFEIFIGLIFFLIFHRLYELCQPWITRTFFAQREKRLDALRNFQGKIALIPTVGRLRSELLTVLQDKAKIPSAQVFTKDGEARYSAIISTSPDLLEVIAADDPAVVTMKKSGTWVLLDDVASTIPGRLALPMPVGGKLFGFIACGPSADQKSYAPDEKRELAAIARETGATLYALQRHSEL